MKSYFVLLGEKSQSLDVVLVSVGEIHTGTYKLRARNERHGQGKK
jgi:hypothetical protein